jgi:putative ABC transport system ATP-binding protein
MFLERRLKRLENIVELHEVSKVYEMGSEKVMALNNINLSIEKGDFCCLLGTSGSGKSTLLNVMAGLEKPTKGQIIVNGQQVQRMSEKKLAEFRQKNIGFVFQAYNLFPTLTALENVEMPLMFKGIPKPIRQKKAALMLKSVGLGDRLNHKPSQMSGGQQQRVGIARAFIGNPPVVFADEPTGNLDTRTTQEIMRLITTIAKTNNQTLVLVTHETEIAGFVDKIIYIRDGTIEKIEIKDRLKED